MKALVPVALFCVCLQTLSATFAARPLDTPNTSTQIARNLAERGEYAVSAWTVLRGPSAIGDPSPLLAYQLPGEPLYLAAAFTLLPSAAYPYLHVPITALLVVAVAGVALAVGGRRAAWLTGLVMSLDPFVLRHGPVWDDVLLGAALEWTALALLLAPSSVMTRTRVIAIGVVAAAAAMTRLHAQLVLATVGLAILAAPSLRAFRRPAAAMLVGVAVGLTAWGARNAVTLGRFFIGSTHDGVTLFRANNATARSSILATGTAEWFDVAQLAPQYAAVAQAGEIEADRYYRRAALDYVRRHPVDALKTAGLKLAISLTGVDPVRSAWSPRNVLFAGWNLAVLLTAGCLAAARRVSGDGSRAAFRWIAATAVVVTLVLLAAGPVGFRYRIDLTGLTYLTIGVAVLGGSRPTPARRAAQT